jgi:hypothetical protein
MSQPSTNPFKIGDAVVFSPNERAVGRSWSIFDRVKLEPGDTGIITRIQADAYLYLDEDRGGFHWECFKKITE